METIISRHPLKFLIAYDGSLHSQAAVTFVNTLKFPEGSCITLVSILAPRETSNYEIVETSMKTAAERLAVTGCKISAELKLGYPSEQIIEYSNNINPHLIIIGAKGLRSDRRILLGGVAQQVVEYSNHPVLVVRAPFEKLKNLLLVTDGSPHSQLALNCMCGITHADIRVHCAHFPLSDDVVFHVLHVLPPAPSPELIARAWPLGPDLVPSATLDVQAEQAWLEEEQHHGQMLIDQAVEKLNESNRKAVGSIIRGDATAEILNYAKEHAIDLIVAGSRGLSRIKGLLLGSVSRKLIHSSNCSVLIVKGLPEE
jgi:nucleotide-binding universal stress UspA family protein